MSNSLGTWSSISDVDVFFSRFTHSNDYKDGDVELALGNYDTIQDGTYNTQWMIARFDMEYNQLDADRTTCNNGYGICFIPTTHVIVTTLNGSGSLGGAYKSSTVQNTHLPDIVSKLQNVLGSHIVQRNVLLSSGVNSDSYSSAYAWTTAYATLMSIGQITGDFAAYRNNYDDGEANYRLPVFNFAGFAIGTNFWVRNIYGSATNGRAWQITGSGGVGYDKIYYERGIRPLIYLR